MNRSPYLVISVSTTGLFSENYTPKLLEVAALLVQPGKAPRLGPGHFHMMVNHPPPHLTTHQARAAQKFHGITPEMSAAAFSEPEVCEAFAAWRSGLSRALFEQGVALSGWRAYNRDFVSSILCDDWVAALGGFSAAGRCVMEDASEVMGAHGASTENWDGSYRYPSLARAAGWLRGRQHTVYGPDKPQAGGQRVPNALCVAQVAEGLTLERQLLRERTAL